VKSNTITAKIQEERVSRLTGKSRRARKPFFMVSSELYKFGLSRSGQDVYVCLCQKADNNDGTSFPGKKEIAANCRIGLTTVYYALKELEAKGLITIEARYEDGHQKSNLYTVYDSLGEAFRQRPENTEENEQTNVPPHSTNESLPIQNVNPYPFSERTPTHSPGEHRTIINELESINYSGGGASPIGGEAAAPTPEKISFGDEFQRVRLHRGEYELLINVHGEDTTKDYINRLDEHIESTGKKYASHYATVYKWINQDKRRTAGGTKAQPKVNRFINFEQHDYDFEKYEQQERAYLEKKYKITKEEKPDEND